MSFFQTLKSIQGILVVSFYDIFLVLALLIPLHAFVCDVLIKMIPGTQALHTKLKNCTEVNEEAWKWTWDQNLWFTQKDYELKVHTKYFMTLPTVNPFPFQRPFVGPKECFQWHFANPKGIISPPGISLTSPRQMPTLHSTSVYPGCQIWSLTKHGKEIRMEKDLFHEADRLELFLRFSMNGWSIWILQGQLMPIHRGKPFKGKHIPECI